MCFHTFEFYSNIQNKHDIERVLNDLSEDIKQIKMHCELTDIGLGKNEIVIFHSYFFNMDISANITYNALKF